MKIRQLLVSIFLVALVAAALSSCKYRLRWMKEEETTTASVFFFNDAATTETTTVPEPSTEDNGVHEVAFAMAPFDKSAVMELYKNALNNVKIRCPGFRRTESLLTQDVTAGAGKLQLANRILELVAKELVRSRGGAEQTLVVPPMSELDVLDRFPTYGKAEGCTLEDYSILTSAVCYTDGAVYKIVITVEDTLNADPEKGEFRKIMTPISRTSVLGEIGERNLMLDEDQFRFDFNYTGNEIICELDAATGNLLRLTQKSVVEVDVDLDLDFLLFRTNFIEAHGTVINRLEFTDFVW